MIIKNRVLLDLDEQPIKQQERPGVTPAPDASNLTAARVLIQAALTPAQGQPYDTKKNAARFEAAVALNKLADDGEIDLDKVLIIDLQNDVNRLYAPIVAGQMAAILDGK